MRLSDSITTIPRLGPKNAELMSRLGIVTIGDFLYHFPTYYRDSSNFVTLAEFDHNQKRAAVVFVEDIKSIRLRGSRRTMQKGLLSDDSGSIEAIWFNQPYLTKTLIPGSRIIVNAKLNPKSLKPQLTSPEFEIIKDTETIHLGRIVPVYPLTQTLKLRYLRAKLKFVLDQLGEIDDFTDTLDEEIKVKFGLMDLKQALMLIHFPESINDINMARRRLGFDELLIIQKHLLKKKLQRLAAEAPEITVYRHQLSRLYENFPFQLTKSQLECIDDVIKDYRKPYPMKRLIQGDVGSGKTVVAISAALPVINSGYQVAVLAPTTVLAQQLFDNFRKYTDQSISTVLVTSKSKISETTPKIDIVIGTHALIYQKNRLFKSLGLVIIDEQHKFGVSQRREVLNLKNSSLHTHELSLTATPIPRTLALTLFGDSEVSILDSSQRLRNINSFVVPENKRTDSYNWISSEITKGNQVFWVCPVIEENKENASVKQLFKQVQAEFKNFRIGMLHGKLPAEEKAAIIDKMRNRDLDILVSTTVIEVGIDIPDANIIVIESAEQFGLAQLHQLRGRVGRRGNPAWCLLFTKIETNNTIVERLNYFASENDGIRIAEYDLARRGPGEVYGTNQSGIPDLKIARFSNLELLKQTREAAEIIFKLK